MTGCRLGAALAIASCESAQEPPPTVAAVVVTPPTVSLVSLGDTIRLAARAEDAHGQALAGKTFAWTSSDPGIAIVGATGLVTAVANGVAAITVTCDSVTGGAAVTVAQKVATVTVSPASASLTALGRTVQLGAGAKDANGHAIAAAAFAWAS